MNQTQKVLTLIASALSLIFALYFTLQRFAPGIMPESIIVLCALAIIYAGFRLHIGNTLLTPWVFFVLAVSFLISAANNFLDDGNTWSFTGAIVVLGIWGIVRWRSPGTFSFLERACVIVAFGVAAFSWHGMPALVNLQAQLIWAGASVTLLLVLVGVYMLYRRVRRSTPIVC